MSYLKGTWGGRGGAFILLTEVIRGDYEILDER